MFTKRVDGEGLSLVFIENHGKAGGEEGWGSLRDLILPWTCRTRFSTVQIRSQPNGPTGFITL